MGNGGAAQGLSTSSTGATIVFCISTGAAGGAGGVNCGRGNEAAEAAVGNELGTGS
jgi:hypothetical protein